MGKSITNGPRLQALENRVKALQMRKAGKTYAWIGKKLGVSQQRAYQYCMEEFKRLREECSETANEALTLALAQIDRLYQKVLPKVGTDYKAADTCLRLLAQKAKLLGIEAPLKIEASGSLGTMSEDQLLAEAKRRGITVADTVIPGSSSDGTGSGVCSGDAGRGSAGESAVPDGSGVCDAGSPDGGLPGGEDGDR